MMNGAMAYPPCVTSSTERPTPGLINLRSTLAINKGRLTAGETRELEAIGEDLHMLLQREMKGRRIQHAAQNVLGLTYYHNNKTEQAIELWEKNFC